MVTPYERERATRDETLMHIALLWQDCSTCLRLQVGALVAIDGRVVVSGYNGAAQGLDHCNSSNCGKDKPCNRTVHAEANCIAFAAKHGIALDGGVMYTTDSPCKACADLIINSGIKEVHFLREYRDTLPLDTLSQAGVICTQYEE